MDWSVVGTKDREIHQLRRWVHGLASGSRHFICLSAWHGSCLICRPLVYHTGRSPGKAPGTRGKRHPKPVLISGLAVNAKSRKRVQAASTCDGAQHQCPGRDQAPTSRSPAVQARGGLVKRGPLRRPCAEQSTHPASRPAVRHSFPVLPRVSSQAMLSC